MANITIDDPVEDLVPRDASERLEAQPSRGIKMTAVDLTRDELRTAARALAHEYGHVRALAEFLDRTCPNKTADLKDEIAKYLAEAEQAAALMRKIRPDYADEELAAGYEYVSRSQRFAEPTS